MKPPPILIAVIACATATLLSGCADVLVAGALAGVGLAMGSGQNSDAELLAAKQKIAAKFNGDPDTDAWHEQRQKITLAIGDRVFDQDFNRVFDSLTVAVSSMELKVGSMERQSGYIAASGITLPPAEAKAMRHDAVTDWCKQNGFDPAALDQKFKSSAYQQTGDMMDLSGMMAKYEKMQKGLTFQLVKMSDTQTKVKLRFADVY